MMSLFFGLAVSLPISLLLLKIFRGRFFVITSPYFAGALYGFWLWIFSIVFLVLDASYDFAGILSGPSGGRIFDLIVNGFASAGFISGGILAALVRVVNPAYPEGTMLAILLMNAFAPTIDYFVTQANVRRRRKRLG